MFYFLFFILTPGDCIMLSEQNLIIKHFNSNKEKNKFIELINKNIIRVDPNRGKIEYNNIIYNGKNNSYINITKEADKRNVYEYIRHYEGDCVYSLSCRNIMWLYCHGDLPVRGWIITKNKYKNDFRISNLKYKDYSKPYGYIDDENHTLRVRKVFNVNLQENEIRNGKIKIKKRCFDYTNPNNIIQNEEI